MVLLVLGEHASSRGCAALSSDGWPCLPVPTASARAPSLVVMLWWSCCMPTGCSMWGGACVPRPCRISARLGGECGATASFSCLNGQIAMGVQRHNPREITIAGGGAPAMAGQSKLLLRPAVARRDASTCCVCGTLSYTSCLQTASWWRMVRARRGCCMPHVLPTMVGGCSARLSLMVAAVAVAGSGAKLP